MTDSPDPHFLKKETTFEGLCEAFADPHSLKKEKMSVNESENSLVSVLFPVVATFCFLLLKRGSSKSPRMPSKVVHFSFRKCGSAKAPRRPSKEVSFFRKCGSGESVEGLHRKSISRSGES